MQFFRLQSQINFHNPRLECIKFHSPRDTLKAYEIDFTDPDSQAVVVGTFLGLIIGLGVPIFYASRDEADEKRLEEIRSLNRSTKEAAGEYMSDEEIRAMRPPRWTDRREFLDDD